MKRSSAHSPRALGWRMSIPGDIICMNSYEKAPDECVRGYTIWVCGVNPPSFPKHFRFTLRDIRGFGVIWGLDKNFVFFGKVPFSGQKTARSGARWSHRVGARLVSVRLELSCVEVDPEPGTFFVTVEQV